ncbi:hypothetical protein B0G76_6729 [Paraburkholderia sp. BL23I1N1]|uniref:hypothetical protein n=1 Tax=Paraburkholderia sp. BL23I1N1 TaxID=1938802 RepID=UPI000FEEBFAD|nr:hypothetical protein [Paraburkholderia sp. BL23I1N1]RKE25207.1 hypothetical protein B0G76_6729 [Paraburkholderia sp. BL23I1N1]
MTNHPIEQTRGVNRGDDKDERPADAPDRDVGSPVPDTAAPILQSEDDELFDEDAPK